MRSRRCRKVCNTPVRVPVALASVTFVFVAKAMTRAKHPFKRPLPLLPSPPRGPRAAAPAAAATPAPPAAAGSHRARRHRDSQPPAFSTAFSYAGTSTARRPHLGHLRFPRAAHQAPRCPAQRPPEAAAGRTPSTASSRAAAPGAACSGRTGRPAHGCCVARAAAAGGFHGSRTRRRVRRRLPRTGRAPPAPLPRALGAVAPRRPSPP